MPDLRSIRVVGRSIGRLSVRTPFKHKRPALSLYRSPTPAPTARRSRSQASLGSTTPGAVCEIHGPGNHALQPTRARSVLWERPGRPAPLRLPCTEEERWYSLTLRQTCSRPEPRAQFAFKDSMIHVQCRSHYVSQFAAFFIVARAKISVVESCLGSCRPGRGSACAPRVPDSARQCASGWAGHGECLCYETRAHPRVFRCVVWVRAGAELLAQPRGSPYGSLVGWMCGIDPSAGSPTETLLRLLLPLNDKVQTSFQKSGPANRAALLIPSLHRTIQSVGATGGVYKGQGRNQRELMTRAY